MRIIVTILIFAIVSYENSNCSGSNIGPVDRFTPDAVIHQLSEQIRFLIKSGDITNGVPVLDPYQFQWKQLNLAKGEMLRANVNLTNGNFTGLGNFRLQKFNFSKSEISIELEINIPTLRFYSGYYELKGSIYEVIPLKGQGVADIELHNISLWGNLYLKPSADGKAILLDKIEAPEFSIDRIVSRTQFDHNIDSIVSSMVEDLLAEYLTRFSKYIATSYVDVIIQYLNPTLSKFETWNLIAVLLSDT